ncbi:hypothetical protein BJY52DRAFT_1215283 [Lactarius psammicola]|nr:hypothetical protein BJY52DRAFT_1215283 [Lactarius psammicola]
MAEPVVHALALALACTLASFLPVPLQGDLPSGAPWMHSFPAAIAPGAILSPNTPNAGGTYTDTSASAAPTTALVNRTMLDHNTHTTTWSDLRLPSTVDVDALHYRPNCQQKIIYFRNQQVMRLIVDAKCDVRGLHKRLMIKFEGEDALDYGGVSRKWLFLLSYVVNPASGMNAEHIEYFNFIDRVLGLAVFHNRFLDAYFVSGFYKTILNKKVDMKRSTMSCTNALPGCCAENDIIGMLDEALRGRIPLGEARRCQAQAGQGCAGRDGGKQREYVDLVVVPRIICCLFDEHKLELLVGGMTEIAMDDWTAERKAPLLQFTKGTSRVSVNGLKHLQGGDRACRFTIEKSRDANGLRCSHTCLSHPDLRPYEG